MKKQLLFFFLFVALFKMVSAQEQKTTDSLIEALKKVTKDSTRINTFIALSRESREKNNLSEALNYANNALEISEKISFNKGIIISHNIMADIYLQQCKYAETMKNYLAALKVAEENDYKKYLPNSYNKLGYLHFQLGNYPEALKYYQSALKIAGDNKDKVNIQVAYNNIGILYGQQGNYPEALKNFTISLQIAKELNDKGRIANSYGNIGIIYEKQKDYPAALKNYQYVLNIEQEIKNNQGIIVVYFNLGKLYSKLHNYTDAKKYFSDALELSKKAKNKFTIKESYLSLARLDSAAHNYNEAYKYLWLFSGMKDSILNQQSDEMISKLKIQYETEKKDKNIQLLNKGNEIKTIRIEEQKSIIKGLVVVFLLIIFFVLVYYRLYIQKRKTKFRHQLLEAEMKALRSQMNPHFTFNVLNSIRYFVKIKDWESSETYLDKFSTLIRLILDQSRTAYINFEQEITMLKLYLELEEMRFEEKFVYSINVGHNISPDKILIPGMLIQPIVENAIKHGIEHKEGSALISISFTLRGAVLLCTVSDNGIGRAQAEKLNGTKVYNSVATSIIRERMDALSSIYNLRLSYKTEDLLDSEGKPEGTRVSIEIPIGVKNEKYRSELIN